MLCEDCEDSDNKEVDKLLDQLLEILVTTRNLRVPPEDVEPEVLVFDEETEDIVKITDSERTTRTSRNIAEETAEEIIQVRTEEEAGTTEYTEQESRGNSDPTK